MRYTWKKECEQKTPDPEVVNAELEKVIYTIGDDDSFKECFNRDSACDILDCVNVIRRDKAFDGKESDEFCNNAPLLEESWDDIPLDDIFIHSIRDITYCFTREELENLEEGTPGFVKNPYTGVFDLNVNQLLSQRWDPRDLLEEDEDEEEDLSLDAQLSVGLSTAFTGIPSYASVSSTTFKELYDDKHTLLKLIAVLLMIKIESEDGNPFRDIISVDAYQSLNTMPELWAQFANDIQNIPKVDFLQYLLARIMTHTAGHLEKDDQEKWGHLVTRLVGDEIIYNEDGIITEETWYNPDGTVLKHAYYFPDGKFVYKFFNPNGTYTYVFHNADGNVSEIHNYSGNVQTRYSYYIGDIWYEDYYGENGNVKKAIAYYADDNKEIIMFRDDGTKETKSFFRADGTIHKKVLFNALGNVEKEIQYRENETILKETFYTRSGIPESEIVYNGDGTIRSTVEY